MSVTDARAHPLADRLPEGLLHRIVEHLSPQRVIVFGSQARGTARLDSDWDLLVVVDDDTPPELAGWGAMGELRRGIRGAIDLVPCRESVFLDRDGVIGSLPWIAATKGITIYERTEKA